jgi:hypothetical protein
MWKVETVGKNVLLSGLDSFDPDLIFDLVGNCYGTSSPNRKAGGKDSII